jgi:hypothetical protein
VIYIIPAAAYATTWLENGNPAAAQTMLRIDEVSYLLPSPAPTSSYPALPFEEVGSGFNDLSVQVGRIPATASSASKNGYRFVGRWMQDPNPVINQNLRYVYQGYTNDGKYLVSFWYPVSTSALPDEVSELSAEQQEQFANDSLAYIAGEAERLNNLSPADWEPDLDQLSALVASLQIEGMPANGLAGTEWLWATTVNTGQEEPPVPDPQKYRLIFSSEDTVDVVADCISVAGSYAAEGGQSGSLTWELPLPDNTDCGPDSSSSQFLNSLPAIQDYRVRVAGNVLELPMPAGGPVLVFGRATN